MILPHIHAQKKNRKGCTGSLVERQLRKGGNSTAFIHLSKRLPITNFAVFCVSGRKAERWLYRYRMHVLTWRTIVEWQQPLNFLSESATTTGSCPYFLILPILDASAVVVGSTHTEPRTSQSTQATICPLTGFPGDELLGSHCHRDASALGTKTMWLLFKHKDQSGSKYLSSYTEHGFVKPNPCRFSGLAKNRWDFIYLENHNWEQVMINKQFNTTPKLRANLM